VKKLSGLIEKLLCGSFVFHAIFLIAGSLIVFTEKDALSYKIVGDNLN